MSPATERLLSVAPATVDRELDILRSVFTVATKVWDYNIAKNPMDAVRRPKYFNERDRRITPGEETRLMDALAAVDAERAAEARLKVLVDARIEGQTFTSISARKKVLAPLRASLLPLAQQTCDVVPLLQTFCQFQLMTAARRSETLSLTWDRIDFNAGTAYLPETKNGRARKLSLRTDLLDMLRTLPRNDLRVFPIGVDALAVAWRKACLTAGLEDLHIHDCRHEAITRVAETGRFGLMDLQNFSGHRDTRMLMRYAHLCASRLAKKLDECFSTEGKYRLHRGRKVLTEQAKVGLADVLREQAEGSTELHVAVRSQIHVERLATGGKVLEFRPRSGR